MEKVIEPGQSIPLRLPVDTPGSVIQFLNDTKKDKKKKFNAVVTSLFINAVYQKVATGQTVLAIPLPGELTEEQQRWIDNQQTRQMIGHWIYQMITQPGNPVTMHKEEDDPKEEREEVFKLDTGYHQNAINSFFDDDDD